MERKGKERKGKERNLSVRERDAVDVKYPFDSDEIYKERKHMKETTEIYIN